MSTGRWVYLSHGDTDHTGNLKEVVEACSNATLVCTAVLDMTLEATGGRERDGLSGRGRGAAKLLAMISHAGETGQLGGVEIVDPQFADRLRSCGAAR